jgi:hypothetical protein
MGRDLAALLEDALLLGIELERGIRRGGAQPLAHECGWRTTFALLRQKQIAEQIFGRVSAFEDLAQNAASAAIGSRGRAVQKVDELTIDRTVYGYEIGSERCMIIVSSEIEYFAKARHCARKRGAIGEK